MSRNLGIEPTSEGSYYFISYNSEDEERVSEQVKTLDRYNLPMWYDDGLKTGEEWETEIANRIEGCDAVILFLTKGIFAKESSYVVKEFRMATRFFSKRVLIVRLDDIERTDVPNRYLSFYLDVENMQSISAKSFTDTHALASKILSDLDFEANPERMMEQLREKYENLDDERKLQLTESYFELWAARREIGVRARQLAELFRRGALNPNSNAISTNGKIGVGLSIFRAETRTVYHTHYYDAELLEIRRDGELIYTTYGRFEPYARLMYYDELPDCLYVIFDYYPHSEVKKERDAREGGGEEYSAHTGIGVVVIENPTGSPRGSEVECYIN